MASANQLHEFIVEQLQDLEGFSYIPMMGGYIYYVNGKIFGGLYEPGFMAKITEASKAFMPDSKPMPPYDGAKDMLPVTILEDKDKLKEMILAMYEELPAPKPKKPRTSITTKRLKKD